MDAIQHWSALVRGSADRTLCASLAERMRSARLTFGGRLLCPFLRPFFLTLAEEARIAHAAETLWRLGERVARVALERPELLDDLGLSDAERRLASIDPGYATASTAARADSFILPASLQFAEYNAESPAGPGYAQRLSELFDREPLMQAFRNAFDVRYYTPIPLLLDALLESYREWGGTANPPRIAIVDWKDVPTWSEFELLRDGFVSLGIPTVISDPRDLSFDGGRLIADGAPVDLVYRRVLINDIVARPDECRALVEAYTRRGVAVANTLRCKIPHKKAFFAVLTDERYLELFNDEEHAIIRAHVPWTRVVRHGFAMRNGERVDLVPYLREHRDRFVLKPNDEYGGTGVTLGWETDPAAWDTTLARAVADGSWVAQERIAIRRERFPVCDADAIDDRDMLVDLAPYLFRGRLSGFLTRLSATGLANVTSGGGQVPAFVASPRL
ncbi:MAG: hypothetical protein DMF84_15405 [Acidobacteria bacterium]|nr:MAG: hypothetical protein DMF84_15405 [Acidobacteriota bacterium]